MALRSIVKRGGAVLRSVSPGLYAGLLRVATSETSRMLRELHRLPRERQLIAELAPRFAVDVRARMGLGATLSWAVGVLAYCEMHGLKAVLRFGNPLYASVPGEDWLDRYFVRQPALEAAESHDRLGPEQYLTTGANLMRRLRPAYEGLTLEHSGELFAGALHFREEILADVDRFCLESNVGSDTLAVHYRGTDKLYEAHQPGIAKVLALVEQALETGHKNLFVASDEPAFLEASIRRFGRGRVVDLSCKQIYAGRPAHYLSSDHAEMAREALMTMLVLSRSGQLIRLRSHLSAWSKMLNPALPTTTLGQMKRQDQFGFPEHLFDTVADA